MTLKKTPTQYTCPFCHTAVRPAHRTEIYYRNTWIKGCHACFNTSISKDTIEEFQAKELQRENVI